MGARAGQTPPAGLAALLHPFFPWGKMELVPQGGQ